MAYKSLNLTIALTVSDSHSSIQSLQILNQYLVLACLLNINKKLFSFGSNHMTWLKSILFITLIVSIYIYFPFLLFFRLCFFCVLIHVLISDILLIYSIYYIPLYNHTCTTLSCNMNNVSSINQYQTV